PARAEGTGGGRRCLSGGAAPTTALSGSPLESIGSPPPARPDGGSEAGRRDGGPDRFPALGGASSPWERAGRLGRVPGGDVRRWSGEPLGAGTVFLYGEQGLGDTLQFVRYAPLVAERGARVVLGVPSPLVRLLQRMPGVSDVVPTGGALPEFDAHCPLLSLPL